MKVGDIVRVKDLKHIHERWWGKGGNNTGGLWYN